MSAGTKISIFDSHLHIVDPRYPLIPSQGFLPENFVVGDYLQAISGNSFVSGAVVSGSFQGYDQDYLVAALKELGPGYVGVTQLPEDVSDAELVRLNSAGVRGLRFNLKRGGSADIRHMEQMASRIHDLVGWHVELYANAADLEPYFKTLIQLPSVSIDHLGLSRKGFDILLRLVERGIYVKATGFGRVDFDIETVIHQITEVNPDALMFGTDLPSTRAPRPYQPSDLELILRIQDADIREKILYRNAIRFYRLGS